MMVTEKKNMRANSSKFGKRVLIHKSEHQIDCTQIDRRALDVVNVLQKSGYEAYIVGGAVRDMLLGLMPKDFDIATNATPEEVKVLFKRSFIIGRRFRIVHVVYGRGRGPEIVEVSTFRAYMDMDAVETVHGDEKSAKVQLGDKTLVMDESGRVLRDNVWGTQKEDAARRDFTINAMYYDPVKEVIVDYHGGYADAHNRILKIIGDAATRYREDPVRILRVVRFSAKLAQLGFRINDKTRRPIHECLHLLKNIPPSRMFDEMIKFLQTGHAQHSVKALHDEGLMGVFPILDGVIGDIGKDEALHKLAWLMFADTDDRVSQGKSVVPSFMLACLLWTEVRQRWEALQAKGEHIVPALHAAITEVFERRVGDVSGRGKLGADMREIWLIQPRFERRTGSAPFNLVNQPRFRAAFDFMRLRAEAGEYSSEIAHWWEVFSSGDESIRHELIQQAQAERKKTKVEQQQNKSKKTAAKRTRRRKRGKKETLKVVDVVVGGEVA